MLACIQTFVHMTCFEAELYRCVCPSNAELMSRQEIQRKSIHITVYIQFAAYNHLSIHCTSSAQPEGSACTHRALAMYVYIIYIYIYIYIYIILYYICTYREICVCVCAWVRIYVYTKYIIHRSRCICSYLYTHLPSYVYTYIYTHVHVVKGT